MNSIIIALNIMRRLMKDITAIGFLFIFPFMGGILAISMMSKAPVVDIGIVNPNPATVQVVQALEGTGKYKTEVIEEKDVETEILSKKFKAVIRFPALEKAISPENPSGKIQLIAYSNDTQVSQLKGILEALAVKGDSKNIGVPETSPPEEDAGRETARMAMGFLTMFMMMFISLGMGMILEDKREKTFMRIFCAPVREVEVVAGNLLANLFLGLLQIGFFLGVTKYLLGIDWGMPLQNVFVIMMMFLIVAIGLGIGLAGVVKSSQTHSVITTILSTSTCMLGGSFFPTDMLGGVLRKLANFIPQKWAMEAFDQMAKGKLLSEVGTNLWILLLFALVFLASGAKVLKPSVEDL